MDPNPTPEEQSPSLPFATGESPSEAAAVPLPETSAAESSTPETSQPMAGEPSASEPAQEEEHPADSGSTAASADASLAAANSGPVDPLEALAEASLRGRLSQPEEERATALIKEALLDSLKRIEKTAEQLPKLPWMIAVNGVSAAWPEMKATFQTRLLSNLAKIDSEASRRVRLSLARGLFKLDPAAALKLAIGAAREMREKETGAMSVKSCHIFANVFIGRAKPWIGQLPVADLKPADADLLIHCALVTGFTLPHAPATQLALLKWAAASNRLGKLHAAALDPLKKTVSRWSAKWQGALRKEIEPLPEEILSLLKPETPESAAADPAARQERNSRQERSEQPNRGEKQERQERPEKQENQEPPRPASDRNRNRERPPRRDERLPNGEKPQGAERLPDQEEGDDDFQTASGEGEREDSSRRQRPPQQQQPQKPRPVYESKTIPNQSQNAPHPAPLPPPQTQQRRLPSNFNLPDALRQIELYTAALRTDLQTTQAKLRQKEDELRKGPGTGSGNRRSIPERAIIIPGEPTVDELARLNRQLETRNAELQQRIEELAADSEDRAASMSMPPDAQIHELLRLKLQEDYEDFLALERELPDLVVQQHYRTVLRHVFSVLEKEGIAMAKPSSPVV